MKDKMKKIITIFIIAVIVMTHLNLFVQEVYAAYEELETQNIETSNKNIQIDAYFKVNEQVKHSNQYSIDSEGSFYTKIYVNNGYLKNAQINLKNANFKMQSEKINSDIVRNTENMNIQLQQINSEQEIEIPFIFERQPHINIEYLNKETEIQLTGTYVNDKGKEIEISSKVKIRIIWAGNPESNFKLELISFIPYEQKNKKGTFVQYKVESGVKDSILPIKESKLNIEVPSINSKYPSEVKVFSTSTLATNGDDVGKNFDEENYSYDNNTHMLQIDTKNDTDENQNISFQKGNDEYFVTFWYEEKYILNLDNKINISLQTKQQLDLYTGEGVVTLNNELRQTNEIDSCFGSIVSGNMKTTEDIKKGYFYDRYNETNYTSNTEVVINQTELINHIWISLIGENFINNNGSIQSAQGKIRYKTIAIRQDMFQNILGDNGYINVYKDSGEIVNIINHETPVDQNGYYYMECNQEIEKIKLEISKPIKPGKIEIKSGKSIISDLNYSESDIRNISHIQELGILQSYTEETSLIEERNLQNIINLQESYTKVELEINHSEFSTLVDNNVTMIAKLRTDNNTYDLFQNPMIKIELPSEIESIELGEIYLMYDNNLSITSSLLQENENGNKEIIITLAGVQENYTIGMIQKGINIVIPAVIRLKQTTYTHKSQINLTYTNEKAKGISYQLEGKEQDTIDIWCNAQDGMIGITKVAGYNNDQEIQTTNSEVPVGRLNNSESKDVRIEMNLVNNYHSTLKNFCIVGRIPSDRNQENEQLKSEFDTFLTREIQVSNPNITVLYSEDAQATAEDSSWKTEEIDFSKVKSYKIVYGQEIGVGECLNVNYSIFVPENLEYGKTSFATYTANYEYEGQTLSMSQSVGIATLNLTTTFNEEQTNTVPSTENDIKMNISCDIGDEELKDGDNIYENEVLRYRVELQNNTNSIVNNIAIESNIPDNTVYVTINDPQVIPGEDAYINLGVYTEHPDIKVLNLEADSLAPGEKKTINYDVKVKSLDENLEKKEIASNFKLKINDVEKTVFTMKNHNQKSKNTSGITKCKSKMDFR